MLQSCSEWESRTCCCCTSSASVDTDITDASDDAPSAPAPSSPAAAKPASWSLDPGGRLGFTATWSGQPVTGRFERWTASIRFSPEALDGSQVTVEIDPASVSTGDPQRDATLPTDDWFNTAAFPKARFVADHFRKIDATHFSADGRLTLKGATRPCRVSFTLKILGDQAQATGAATLDRTQFGVGQGDYGGTDQIAAAVAVSFSFKAHRQPAD